MQTETLSVRISKAESRALRERARKEGISKGSLVRRALRAYGVTPEAEVGKSGYDAIKHLLGKNRGKSRDLSSNPAHLEDYGR
ncbi:MAG: CopG family transcriptional regulator [Burkholderiaceae bacterium]|nr:CopG family transcriptional regulator [Burkholderiaceae bacterium]